MTVQAFLQMPLAFWLVLVVLGGGIIYYLRDLRNSLAVPVIAVLGTVSVWYVGDVFYNDYVGFFLLTFPSSVLAAAWWQVAWFLVVFLFLSPVIHRWYNAKFLKRPSYAYHLFRHGVANEQFQRQVNLMLGGCLVIWGVLVTIALARLQEKIPCYFFPFLGEERADPWGRDRIGAGFDALLSLAGYTQLFTAASFGVVAAIARNPAVRLIAIAGCALTWPYYIFDRSRNQMLAVIIPAILMWAFFRVRGSLIKRFLLLLPVFAAISLWFAFVVGNRSSTSVAHSLQEKGFAIDEMTSTHHEGLNMYEELCWINGLMDQGSYKPNWGELYFAEAVNPIPRTLFPAKPYIGLDYAVARGQGKSSSDGSDANATIATGMIGQGVVNFGVILGPIASAFLMACWVTLLARLDLNGEKLGRIPLFGLGIILTFNLGRDITFITLYPLVFGGMLIWLADRMGIGELPKMRIGARAKSLLRGKSGRRLTRLGRRRQILARRKTNKAARASARHDSSESPLDPGHLDHGLTASAIRHTR